MAISPPPPPSKFSSTCWGMAMMTTMTTMRMRITMGMMTRMLRMNVWAALDCLIVTSHAFHRSCYYRGKSIDHHDLDHHNLSDHQDDHPSLWSTFSSLPSSTVSSSSVSSSSLSTPLWIWLVLQTYPFFLRYLWLRWWVWRWQIINENAVRAANRYLWFIKPVSAFGPMHQFYFAR